ncbi:hypothetical protein CVS40_6829 [Lucilia cuprina]|nr:hypothetical protein CVS40_6829 [Lucilia cuprina]
MNLVINKNEFRRICEHIQSQVCSKRFRDLVVRLSTNCFTQAVSESSVLCSVSSGRLSYKKTW